MYAQLLERSAPTAVVDAAHRLGIESELDAHPSIALGAEEVSPDELARAYLTFADDGNRVDALRHRAHRGRRRRHRVGAGPASSSRSSTRGVTRAVTHALRGVIDGGTGTAADIGRPAAGKTGTTQDNVDAWFAGYVPGYAAVVWMGYPEGAQPMDDVHGRSVTGGSFPAEIWSRFMTVAMEGREVAEFEEPPDELLAPGGDRDVDDADASSTSSPSSSSSTSTSSPDDSTTTSAPDDDDGSTTTSTTERRGPTTTATTAPPETTTTAPPDDAAAIDGDGNGTAEEPEAAPIRRLGPWLTSHLAGGGSTTSPSSRPTWTPRPGSGTASSAPS